MREDLFGEMYRLEEKYWWHIAKRELVEEELNARDLSKAKVFLDVGCGTGMLLSEVNRMKKWKLVVGLDGSKEAIRFSRQRAKIEMIEANFEHQLPLADQSVDVVTSLDVVEHVSNDRLLLGEIYRILKPNGLAIITVPAYQWLWSYWDEMLHHKRRYSASQLRDKISKAKFRVLRLHYFYSFLLPVVLVVRLLKSKSSNGGSDFVAVPDWVNQSLIWVCKMERWLMKWIRIPFGLSIVCVLQKH